MVESVDEVTDEHVPLFNEALFQMRNVSYPGLVYTFLQHTPDLNFPDLHKNIESMFAIILVSLITHAWKPEI